MTTGFDQSGPYDWSAPAPRHSAGAETGSEPEQADRPGPLPPRLESPYGGYPSPGGYPSSGGFPSPGGEGVPGGEAVSERTGPLPSPVYQPPAPVFSSPTPVYAPPGYGVPAPRQPYQEAVVAPVTGIPGTGGYVPQTAAVPPGYVAGPPGYLAGPPRRGRWQVVALVVLLVAVLGQGVYLVVLQQRLSTADRHISQTQDTAAKNQNALNIRIKALEKQAAQSLDSTAVAEAVLPSVFRVDAGNFSGTAFAIGNAAPSGGGTDLLTNFHVVSSVYNKGGRDATLTHDNQRFAVKIAKVDQTNDLALLHSDQKFDRLAVAAGQVESGAPVVVVGAPLGLSQSVTTGVVSAVRNDFPGESGKTFIQFSAPINPGNSGGPVINAQKQVVGIATAKATDAEGIGLAIPISIGCRFTASC